MIRIINRLGGIALVGLFGYLFIYYFGDQFLPKELPSRFINHLLSDRLGITVDYRTFHLIIPNKISFRGVRLKKEKKTMVAMDKLSIDIRPDWGQLEFNLWIVITGIDLNKVNGLEETLRLPKAPSPPPDRELSERKKLWQKIFDSPTIAVRKAVYSSDQGDIWLNATLYGFERLAGEIETDHGRITIQGSHETKRIELSGEISFPFRSSKLTANLRHVAINYISDTPTLDLEDLGIRIDPFPYSKLPLVANLIGKMNIGREITNSCTLHPVKGPHITADGKIKIKTGKTFASYSVRVDSLRVSPFQFGPCQAEKINLQGYYSPHKKEFFYRIHNLEIQPHFLKYPISVSILEGSMRDTSFQTDPAGIGLHKELYTASLSSEDISKSIKLTLEGERLNLNVFTTEGQRKGKRLRLPPFEIDASMEELSLKRLKAMEVKGMIRVASNRVFIPQSVLTLFHARTYLAGHYNLKEKIFQGNFSSSDISEKTIVQLFEMPMSLKGKLGTKGEVTYGGGNTYLRGTISNRGSLLIQDSYLQKKIWTLPFITSKKTTLDIATFLQANFFASFFPHGKNKYDVTEGLGHFGEYQLALKGEFNKKEGEFLYKADVDLFFTDYFKNNYINASEILPFRSKDISTPIPGWNQENILRFHIDALQVDRVRLRKKDE